MPMVKDKSAEEYNSRRIFKSLQAYLEGEQNLKWILGVIGQDTNVALGLLQERLTEYGRADRREQLLSKLEELG